jgi:hypothetical protein
MSVRQGAEYLGPERRNRRLKRHGVHPITTSVAQRPSILADPQGTVQARIPGSITTPVPCDAPANPHQLSHRFQPTSVNSEGGASLIRMKSLVQIQVGPQTESPATTGFSPFQDLRKLPPNGHRGQTCGQTCQAVAKRAPCTDPVSPAHMCRYGRLASGV